jgi:multidrug resistance protein MdtO
MASASIQAPRAEGFTTWLPDFLKKELAPYPGRTGLVARTVISATLTMILIVTFRIPGGVVGALSAFVFSRENLLSTTRSAIYLLLSFAIGALFIPIGARFFASTPETHFVWVACSLFMVFFLLRTLTIYAVATGLALVVANVVGIWYLPGPAEMNVELTLWLVAGTLIGALVTLSVEIVYYAFHRRDDLIDGLDARLALIADEMASYAAGAPIAHETENKLAQFAIVGGGAMRRNVARANYSRLYKTRMTTLVSLIGRSIDFAAALSKGFPELPSELRERANRLAQSITEIRQCLKTHGRVCATTLTPQPSPSTPLMSELESMVALMPSIFSAESATDPLLEPLEDEPESTSIFVADAFTNPDHLRFVLGGTVAAMMCYILYVGLDWPNLSTSVTTCVLTALTTIGSSRQKQILRIAGFLVGGVLFGLGAQIFVLPYIDSITGFTVFFAISTAIAAWIGTSSSRLSYAGVQFAFVFYSVHLSEFTFQTSLTAARDRVLGVALGVSMMWLVFERLSPRSASDEMIRIFIVNLRVLAQLVEAQPCAGVQASILKIRRLREEVYRHFGEVLAQADAVPFETGPLRAGDMAARDRIRHWQASLRSFYLLEAPLLQFRAFGDASKKSPKFMVIEDEFRAEWAHAFRLMADSLENQQQRKPSAPIPPANLAPRLEQLQANSANQVTEREQTLLRMSTTIAQLLDHLQNGVASEPLYAVE